MTYEPKRSAPLKSRVSRRDFFGQFSAAAGYAVTGSVALAADLAGEAVSERPIRVAILGMGHRGTSLADTIRKIPAFSLAGWYEPCEEVARRASARFGGDSTGVQLLSFADEAEAIESSNVDAVVIAGPSDTHHRQIVKAIAARKHILTEKPAGFDKAELDRIEQVLEGDFDRSFLIGYQRRYNAARNRLIAWLAEGHIGPMIEIRVDWSQPLGAPRGRDEWMTDPARTGDWVAEHGDHIWDLLAELRPGFDIPRPLHAVRIPGAGGGSAFFKTILAWPDAVTADIRHSFLPGGQFASPGLNVIVQYRSGIVDMLQGRVNCDRKLNPPEPFEKSGSEETSMLQAFAQRIRTGERSIEALRVSNLEELRRACFVDRLRESIVTEFGNRIG
jgi:predicted dehydrogenase